MESLVSKGCQNRKRDQAWFSWSLTDDPDLWLPQLLQQPAVIFRKTSTEALRDRQVEFVISGWDKRREVKSVFFLHSFSGMCMGGSRVKLCKH